MTDNYQTKPTSLLPSVIVTFRWYAITRRTTGCDGRVGRTLLSAAFEFCLLVLKQFRLLVAVVSLAGLYGYVFLIRRHLNFVIPRLRRASPVGGVTEAVLVAKFFLDLRVDLID